MRVRGLSGIRIGLRPVHLLGEVESNEPGTSTKLSGDEESCQQKFTATSLLSAKVSDLTWGKRKNSVSVNSVQSRKPQAPEETKSELRRDNRDAAFHEVSALSPDWPIFMQMRNRNLHSLIGP